MCETLIWLDNFNSWGKGFGNGAEYVLADRQFIQHNILALSKGEHKSDLGQDERFGVY